MLQTLTDVTDEEYDKQLEEYAIKLNLPKEKLNNILPRSESVLDVQNRVNEFLTENIYFNEKDVEFLKKFNKGYYHPELLFESEEILERIKNHPMALWKTKNNRDNIER